MTILKNNLKIEQKDEAQAAPRSPLAANPLLIGILVGGTAVMGGIVLAFGGPLAALALLLAGAAAFVVLRDIEIGFWGVIGVVCLLPFATLPVGIGVTPTFLDLALGAVVGIWALGIVTGQQRTVVTAPVTVPLLIFILIAIFSFIFGLSNGPLTSSLLRRFAEIILSLAFVLVIVDYCRTWERLERLVKVVLLAGAAGSVLAIGLWLLPDETANELLNMLVRLGYPGGWVIRYIEENPELAERAIGTAVDPNVLGGLLLMIGALAGPQVVAKRPLFPRWLTWTITGLVFVAILLTFSRGAMVGLAAGLGFVALARHRRLLPTMAVTAVLLLFLPAMQEYIARFVEGIQGQDLATQMRFGEYKDALILIQRYPIFGVGFAGAPDIDIYLGVANVYLTIAQMMGVIGLASFFVVMGVVLGQAFFNRHIFKASQRLDPVWLGLHAAVIGGLVVGVFDRYLFSLDFQHAVTGFWLFVGLAAASTRLGRLEAIED
ncbi:MAG: O-antigen ligase family protein [Anaerolineae bacterium]